MNMFTSVKLTAEAAKGAADNETLTGTGVDMSDYAGVAFVLVAEAGEALNFSIKAQEAALSDFSDAADLAGTATTIATTVGAAGIGMLEIYRPLKRYVRAVVTVPNATAAKGVAVAAIRHSPAKMPLTNTGELHISPVAGTA